ncbi:MAG TPA: hypothetical protein VKK31_08045 [Thermoanaerobaculia bacterium]|nr:hypothetical protein [Thermoanaerobaculia bacterium]
MELKDREEKLAQVKDQIAKLEEINVDALSDEDLESAAGGFCSIWCCSGQANATADETGG